MQNQDFTTGFVVDQTATEVYNAILQPQKWWSEEIEGVTDQVGGVFDYHFQDVHRCRVKIPELVPDRKVSWLILENDFNFTMDKSEWVNTTVQFEITAEGDKTRLAFTHIGLVPAYECYDACHQGSTHYIQVSLFNYITTGEGSPNKTGAPQTETEKELAG